MDDNDEEDEDDLSILLLLQFPNSEALTGRHADIDAWTIIGEHVMFFDGFRFCEINAIKINYYRVLCN